MPKLVEAEGLALGYSGQAVISGLSLSLGAGEGPLALCGPNGAGKSTFLKACLGLLRPLSGELRVLGGSPGRPSGLRRIGYVPQSRPGGGPRVTAGELAAMGREAQRGILRPLGDGDRQAVQAALVRCGVFDLKDRPVDELSGGQFQRVLLARALAPNPELLIMDEPSAHLDAASRKGILDVIADLSGKAGLLIVSHDRELLSLCSRFIHFEAGQAGEVKSPLGGDDA